MASIVEKRGAFADAHRRVVVVDLQFGGGVEEGERNTGQSLAVRDGREVHERRGVVFVELMRDEERRGRAPHIARRHQWHRVCEQQMGVVAVGALANRLQHVVVGAGCVNALRQDFERVVEVQVVFLVDGCVAAGAFDFLDFVVEIEGLDGRGAAEEGAVSGRGRRA